MPGATPGRPFPNARAGPSRRRAVALALISLSLGWVLVGCTSSAGSTPVTSSPTETLGARPSSPAKLAILSPTNGEVVHGSSVVLRVSLKDAKIVPSTTLTVVPDQGHLHVYLDGALVTMTGSLRTVIPNVAAGQHILRVEFVASDHAPFDPRVIQQVAFEAKR